MPENPPNNAPNDALREEFNRWAEAGKGEAMELDHLPIVLPVLDRMHIVPEDNILEVGCGAGWLSALLAEQVPEGRVVGMDVSDEMIRHARRRNLDVDNTMFVIGAVEEIPWDASFFTQVISVESAYYWPDPARGLREIFRVLREGGWAWIVINYYRDNPHTQQWANVFEIPAHWLSVAEWTELFEQAGFAEVQQFRVPDPTPAPDTYRGRWFRDAEQLRAFRQEGALAVCGRKPVP